MSANFHTAYPDPVALTSANLESPLSQLDQAITNLTIGVETIDQLNLGSFTSKTISSGAITGDFSLITVDTEGAAASDDLDTISSPTAGDFMIIKIANNARVVTIRHNGGGSGNIRTYNTANVILSDTNKLTTLVYNGSNWVVLPDVHNLISFPSKTATLSSDAITYTSTYMRIDTEASAASDNLSTINGGVDGAVLIVKTTNSARDVLITSGIGNIKTPNGVTFFLDTIDQFALLVYDSTTTTWNLNTTVFGFSSIDNTSVNADIVKVSNNIVLTSSTSSNISHPLASSTQPYLDIMPQGGMRQIRVLSAAETTLEGFGFGTLTVSGTPNNNFGGSSVHTGSLVRYQSGASSGNLGGVISPFTLTCRDNRPYFRIVFSTYTSILVQRTWVGLSSAAIGNTDDPGASGIHFVGLRYSTVAGDTTWKFVTSDGATTNVVDSGYGNATGNILDFVVYANSSGNFVFYIRSMAITAIATNTLSSNLPGATTALGLNARIETREAVAKSLQISGVALYH